MGEIGWISRREVVRLLGIGGAALAAGLPAKVHAAASGGTLVLGIDISDSITFDPAREAQYTAPLSLRAAYESLVTMSPGDYLEVKPALASSWAKTADSKGWRFHLADAKFNSGNPVTADDVKWTFERLINLKDQPSQYVTNVSAVNVIDPKTVDLMLVDPTQPILAILSGPNFGIMEQKAVAAQGGTAAKDAVTADKATNWLNQHSAGAGPFTLVGWTRGAQILLTRNEHYFRGPVQFEHVIVRHMG
ncbi:MAG TPA: ABC transporter substrate-binding protein, partial [Rhodopila sp.]